jgi:hypothetical protein
VNGALFLAALHGEALSIGELQMGWKSSDN